MRVMVTLTITGEKETRLTGDAAVFGNHADYREGFDSRLRDIGFWLENWRYNGCAGPSNHSRVFIPWTSALMIEELK